MFSKKEKGRFIIVRIWKSRLHPVSIRWVLNVCNTLENISLIPSQNVFFKVFKEMLFLIENRTFTVKDQALVTFRHLDKTGYGFTRKPFSTYQWTHLTSWFIKQARQKENLTSKQLVFPFLAVFQLTIFSALVLSSYNLSLHLLSPDKAQLSAVNVIKSYSVLTVLCSSWRMELLTILEEILTVCS